MTASHTPLASPLTIDVHAPVLFDASVAIPNPSTPEFSSLLANCMASIKKKGRDHVSTQMLITQVLLAFTGAFAGILYLDPARACAETACDDGWLANMVPETTARQWLYFLSGFIGYGSTNCTFSYYGPQQYMDMLADLNSPLAKVLATGGVISFVSMQGLQIFLTARGTDSSNLNLIMSVAGAAPGALYSAAGLVKRLPYAIKNFPPTVKNLVASFRSNSQTRKKRMEMARADFYAWQRKQFNAMIKAKWKSVVAKAATYTDIAEDENSLLFLLNQDAKVQHQSWGAWSLRKIVQVGGVGLSTAAYQAAFINNTFTVLSTQMDNVPARWSLASVLSASSLYGCITLAKKAITTGYDALANKVQGEPIDSLVFQLRPIQTSAIVFSSTLLAFFSYSIADIMWQKMWPSETDQAWNNDAQTAGRAIARAGIDIYHLIGPSDVGTQMLFRRILSHGTPSEKFLARTQLVVEYLTATMPQQEFIEQIEENFSDEQKVLLKLQSCDEMVEDLRELDREVALKRLAEYDIAKYADDIFSTPGNVNQARPKSASAAHWASREYLLASPASGANSSISPNSTEPLDVNFPLP